MNDTLNEKIKEIGSMFGINEFPENLGEIVESFISNDKSDNNKEYDIKNEIKKYVQIMNRLKEKNFNSKNNKKIQLLNAIEPFLNNKRKDKVSNCIKFITFADLAKDLNIF